MKHALLQPIIDNYDEYLKDEPQWFKNLTGKVLFSFDKRNGVFDGQGYFYFGPQEAVEGSTCLHDGLYCDQWLEKTLNKLAASSTLFDGVTFSIGDSENAHSLLCDNLTDAKMLQLVDAMVAYLRTTLAADHSVELAVNIS